MSYQIRSGRGKAKGSKFVKTDEDARKVVMAAMGSTDRVELSTGRFIVSTTKPSASSPTRSDER